MWANYYDDRSILLHRDESAARVCAVSYGIRHPAVPVVVIPLDDAEAIVVTAAAAHYKAWSGVGKPTNGDCMRAALTAIGVLPRAKKGGCK